MPFGPARADFTTLPAEFLSWTVTPGRPSSPLSTTPGLPPPGVKSRQTTPVISPGLAFGVTACTAPLGTAVGGIPVSGSVATPPGATGALSTSAPPAAVCRAGVDGNACDSTPAGEKTPSTERESALMAPRLGSCWYMIRQVTPVAKADTAIGRKTAVLNATAQRTFSVSTAKIRPSAVTRAGTTATQIALFLIAVVSVEVVKRRV